VPPHAQYKALQDLFRYIAREAGCLGMAVHIHSLEVWCSTAATRSRSAGGS